MINELIKHDTNFNEASFKSYIDNIFVKLLTSVMVDEIDKVKHFLSDTVYNEYQEKIEKLKKQQKIQMYDELNVKTSNISNIEITDNLFKITVNLTARYMDYQLSSSTGKLINGDNTKRIEVPYKLVFTKKRDFSQYDIVRKCKTCGATLSINTSGQCEFCKTIYNQSEYDYILESITKIN